jgi:MFS family permease
VVTRYPDFRRLFVGDSVSLLGSSVTTVALPLTAAVCLHASAAQMGLLGAMTFVPQLALGLPAGVWVDRMPYRRMLVVTDLARALLLGAVPVLAVTMGALAGQMQAVILVLYPVRDLSLGRRSTASTSRPSARRSSSRPWSPAPTPPGASSSTARRPSARCSARRSTSGPR